MNKHRKVMFRTSLILSVCLFIIGCHPKRITWSPDGKWAAYCNDTGLFFIDGEGTISEKMLEHVYRAEWFPDGKHLAIEQFTDLATWKQVKKTVSAEHQEKYVKYANSLKSVKNKESWDKKIKMLQELNILDEDELNAVKLYIRDAASADFPKEMIASWGNRIEFHYQFFRIAIWDGEEFTVSEPLWQSPERIWDMRVSPKGKVIAFTTAFPGDFDEGTVSSLWVVDIEQQRPELLDKNAALYPDWDVEGTSLIYVRSIGKESTDNPLGTLLVRQVCSPDGTILSDFPEPEPLAGLVANEFTKVRCLSDGRIVFSSMEVTLPVIGKDIPEQKQLFVLDPKRQSTITRLIPRSQESRTHGFNLDFFEVSPDETIISIPDDDGRVAALTMAKGDFVVLEPEGTDDIKTVPVWRYPNELCYIDISNGGLLGDKKLKQIVLRQVSPDGTWDDPRPISKNWPKEGRKNILD